MYINTGKVDFQDFFPYFFSVCVFWGSETSTTTIIMGQIRYTR